MLKTDRLENGRVLGQKVLPERIILTGFRATGKSVVGQLLAGMIGYRFVDTDKELISRVQSTVAKFVTEHGWPAFRKFERELLERLSKLHQVVIATGGGAILHYREWEQLRKKSLVVWLQADPQTISDRLRLDPATQDQRPPLRGENGQAAVASVLAEREPFYQKGSDMAVDTSDKLPEDIALLIKDHIMLTEKA